MIARRSLPSLLLALGVACSGRPAPPVVQEPVEKPAPPPAAVEPRTELTVELSPMSVVSTGPDLVWTDAAGAVWMRHEGGQPAQLSDQRHPDFAFSLLLAGDAVFATARHGLLRIDVERKTVTQLAVTGLPDQPEEAVADARYLYVTIYKHDEVMKIPVAGGKAQKLASISRGVLGLSGSTLYVASYSKGTLSALSIDGGTPRAITRGLPRPTAVAADASHVYVYCERDQILRKIDPATGQASMIARGLVNSDDIVLDGDWIYTRTWGKRSALVRYPKTGGPAQTLADDLRSPYRIAVDARAVYVTSRDDRRIIRLDKASLDR